MLDDDSVEYERLFLTQYPQNNGNVEILMSESCNSANTFSSPSSPINSRRSSNVPILPHQDSCSASICSSGNSQRLLPSWQNSKSISSTLATGNVELDECLMHHLERACHSITTIHRCQNSPFEFTLMEMLTRMEAVS